MFMLMCVGTLAGCGEDKYKIEVVVSNAEYGRVSGGGNYAIGDTVTIKVEPNLGCEFAGLTYVNADGVEETSPLKFTVSTETIRKYTANFSCVGNNPESIEEEHSLKYTVTYKYYRNGESTEYTGVSNDDKSEIVLHGRKIEEKVYVDGILGSLKWYTDGSFITEYDFDSIITENKTLYAKEQPVDASDVLNDFRNSKSLLIAEEGGGSVIVNNMDTLNDADDSNNTISISKDGDIFYQNGTSDLYFYNSGENSKIKLEGFALEDITDVYKYMELKDLDISSYTVSKGSDYNQLDINDGDIKVYSLWVQEGKIVKFQKGDGNLFTVTYNSGGVMIPNNALNAYFISVYSNDEDVSEHFVDINKNMEKFLSIIPSKGQNLESILNDFYSSDSFLKSYAFNWTNYSSSENVCFGDPFAIAISSNKNVCFNVVKRFSDIPFDSLQNVNSIKTSVATDVGTVEASMNITNILSFDISAPSPEDNTKGIVNSIKKLLDVYTNKNYYNFTFEDDTYNFYQTKTSSFPFITITVDASNEIIESFSYFDGRNTYVSSIIRVANSWETEPSIDSWVVGQEQSVPNTGEAQYAGTTIVEYKASGASEYSSVIPTTAGSYVMRVTVKAEGYMDLVKEVEFSILNAMSWSNEPTDGVTITIGVDPTWSVNVEGATILYYYKVEGQYTTTSGLPTEAGTYDMKVVAEKEGYQTLVKEITSVNVIE